MDSTIQGIPLADELPGPLTLGGFLHRVCRENAHKEALVFYPPSGPAIRRTYAQVWDEAFAVARALVARGVTKETRVGLLATNRPEWITAMFGIEETDLTLTGFNKVKTAPLRELAVRRLASSE